LPADLGISVPDRPASIQEAHMPILLDASRTTDDRLPLVEHRLYSSRVCLSCLKRLALLAITERESMTLVADLPIFAGAVRRFATAIERHIRAVESVLPLSASQVEAPSRRRRA